MSGFRTWVPLFSAVFYFGISLRAETDPDVLLRQALQLADFYNWIDAEPSFREAERLYGERGDNRNALYAKLGRIRSTMERVSLPEVSAWLTSELERNTILQNDKELRLFCLIVKGDIPACAGRASSPTVSGSSGVGSCSQSCSQPSIRHGLSSPSSCSIRSATSNGSVAKL
jgi:hypothetical protein